MRATFVLLPLAVWCLATVHGLGNYATPKKCFVDDCWRDLINRMDDLREEAEAAHKKMAEGAKEEHAEMSRKATTRYNVSKQMDGLSEVNQLLSEKTSALESELNSVKAENVQLQKEVEATHANMSAMSAEMDELEKQVGEK